MGNVFMDMKDNLVRKFIVKMMFIMIMNVCGLSDWFGVRVVLK